MGQHAPIRPAPAIVSPALFEKAQRQLTSNLKWLRAHPKREYILRGLLTCACGHSLIGGYYPTKAGEIETYRCISHPTGQAIPNVQGADLAAKLWAEVVSFFEHPDEVLRTVVSRKATASADEDRAERELLRLAGELRALDKQEARALDAHLRDIVSPAVLRAKVDELHKRRTVIEQRMVAVREDRARAARTEEDAVRLRTTLTVLAHRARTAGIQTKAEILRALVKRGSNALRSACASGSPTRSPPSQLWRCDEPTSVRIRRGNERSTSSWRRRCLSSEGVGRRDGS